MNSANLLSENPRAVTEINLKRKSMKKGDGLSILRLLSYFPSLKILDLRMTALSNDELKFIQKEIDEKQLKINLRTEVPSNLIVPMKSNRAEKIFITKMICTGN